MADASARGWTHAGLAGRAFHGAVEMLKVLSRKSVLIGSLSLMSMMFIVVMFFVNPSIDGRTGSSLLWLQLSFDKEAGIKIIRSWGPGGIEKFRQLIFTDYIYASTYSLFSASLISYLAKSKRRKFSRADVFFVCTAFSAGILDFIENSMELSFVGNPNAFSGKMFFVHSVIAGLKWSAVVSVVIYVLRLLTKKNKIHKINR